MSLAAVILNWNQADDTITCVRDLEAVLEPGDAIWVVDNASRGDDAARIARACTGVRLIGSERNLGFGGGNNLAIRQILAEGSDHVLLINNDARIERADLTELRRSAAEHSDIAVVGPLLFDGDEVDRLLSAGGLDIARHVATHDNAPLPASGGGDPEDSQTLREVDYVPGTCALIAVDALREVGLLDEEYFFAGEMADLCRRMWLAGRPCAVSRRVRALHFTSRSSSHRGELYAYYVLRNRFLYLRRHYPESHRKLARDWTFRGIRFWLEALLQGDRRRARALRMALMDGRLGRFGDRNRAVLGERSP